MNDDGRTIGPNDTFEANENRKLEPGECIGEHRNYRLEQKLGEGGMGQVWLASELLNGECYRKVACKLFPKGEGRPATDDVKASEEFDRMVKLRHPNICQTFGMSVDSDFGPFIIMDVVDGVTLEKWFLDQPNHENGLSVAQVVQNLRPIAEALDYAHSKLVFHRDVKPQNIMMTEENGPQTPLLLDFGIASKIHSVVSMTEDQMRRVGTPTFMSPEQCKGEPQNGQTDQYALATVAYLLLSGRVPFEIDDTSPSWMMTLSNQIVNEKPALIPALSDAENAALQKALSKTSDDRFATCTEFINTLQSPNRFLLKLQSLKTFFRPKRRRWVIGAGVVFLLLIIGLWSGDDTDASKPDPSVAANEAAQAEAKHLEAVKKAQAEKERLEAEKADAEKLAQEEAEKRTQAEAKRLEAEAEVERLNAENQTKAEEKKRLEAAKAEAERQAQAEALRRTQAEAERQIQAEAVKRAQAETKRLEAENEVKRLNAEKLAKEENERLEAAKAEAERQAQAEALSRAQAEAKRLEAEKEVKRLEAEKQAKAAAEAEAKRLEAEKQAKAAAEAEAKRLEAEKQAKADEEAEAKRLEAEKQAKADEEAEAKRLEAEKQAKADEENSPAEPAAVPVPAEIVLEEIPEPKETAQAEAVPGFFIEKGLPDQKYLENLSQIREPAQNKLAEYRNILKDYSPTAPNAAALQKELDPYAFKSLRILEQWLSERQEQERQMLAEGLADTNQKLVDLREIIRQIKEPMGSYTSSNLPQKLEDYEKLFEIVPGTRMVKTVNNVEFAFRWCPAGTFKMGSPSNENHRYSTEIQHDVTLTSGFWMLETEVTQKMWKALMGNNPSDFRGDNRPVENVSWGDCQKFCIKMKEQGLNVSLPTEAQWEYACRAGTTGAFAGDLNAMAWIDMNSSSTHDVKTKKPNAWNLYDMHGNIWERCSDSYEKGYYSKSPKVDPTGPAPNDSNVFRGGDWNTDVKYCRSAYRTYYSKGKKSSRLGFRILLVQKDSK